MDSVAWWAAVHGVSKSWTRLSDVTVNFHFHALEKEMATHSSVLAWRIPGTGEPGGLPSLASRRVGHDWSDLAAELIFPFYWGKILIFPSVPCILRLSSLADGNRHNSWPWVRAGSVLSNPFKCVFQLQVICSGTHAGHFSAESTRGSPCRSLEFSLCSPHFSGTLSHEFQMRWSFYSWLFFSEPSVMTGLHLGLSSLNRGLDTQGCKLVNQRAHLVFFSSLKGSLIFTARCTASYKPLFHIFCPCFSWSFQMGG